jgi:PAS domain S-box-containing protein
MRIKKRLQINIAISFLTVLVICLVLLISLSRLNKANKSEKIADDIMTGTFEMVTLRSDYSRNNTNRAKEQWYAKHEQVGRLLESAMANFRSAEDRNNISRLIEVHESIGRIFSSIVANSERNSLNPASVDLSHDVEERLLNQMNMRVYEVAILNRKLLDSSTEARVSALRLAGGGVFLTLLILIASATLNTWTLSRMITARMLRLREGAEVIGGGNLDHRIDVTGDDEFAELSDAFNTMTAKLSGSHRDLEEEIKERGRAEETIKQSQKTFAQLIERSPFGTYVVDSQFRIAMMNASSQEGAFRNVRPIVGRPFDEAMRILWPEPVAAEIIAHFRHTLETGEPYYSPQFINPRHDADIVESYEWELHRMTLPDGQHGVICYYYDSTKLRQAEAALRESEERLALAASATQIGMFDWNLARGSVLWTQAHEAIFGYTTTTTTTTTTEHHYSRWADRVHPEDLPVVEEESRRCMQDRRPLEVQYRIIWPDGSLHWVETKGVFQHDSAGKASRLLGVVMDITERQQAKEALAAAHRQTQSLIDNTTAMVYACDLEERFVLANAALAALLKTTPAQLLSKRRHEFMPQADANAHEAADREVIAAGRAVEFEEHSDLHGRSITWLSTKFPLRDAQGRIYGVAGIVTDISERKRAEEALRGSEQKYRNLFENMAEEVHYWQIVRDEDGRIKTWRLVDANPPTLKSWGRRTAEEIRGKTTDEIFGPGATEHYMPVVEKIMTEGIPYSFEDYFPNLDKYFRFTSVPFGDFFITTGADITVIKQAQESLKASLAEKEVLLKEIHHRVKNNMQVISSLVSLQADQLQDAGMSAILYEMAQRVRSMAMVHEKLYQSHNLAGVEFSDYAKSLLNYLWRSHASAASAVRLTLDMEPVSLTVNTAVPCGLILNELVSNALKHAFRGRNGGEVTVSLRRGEQGGMRLSVRDDGIGLPAEFDWKQAKSLGLRLVQMLAGQLHADLEVSSDRGTEFTIAFEEPKT